MTPVFKPGDPVWYRQTCYGGYGFQRDIPATFLGRTLRRARIELTTADSGETKRIAVAPSNIRKREAL